MRVGNTLPIIHSTDQLESGVVTSDDILNGTIENADIKTTAGIESGKLDLSSITQDLILAVSKAYDLGSALKLWNYGYFEFVQSSYWSGTLQPYYHEAQQLGSPSKSWNGAWLKEINGKAGEQILLAGLLGG